MKHRRRHFKLSKKSIIVAIILILVVLSSGFVFRYGIISVADNEASKSIAINNSTVTELTSKIKATLNNESISKSFKITKLSEYSNDISKLANDVCHKQSTLIYYRYISRYQDCDKIRKSLSDLAYASNSVYRYLADEAVLSELLPKDITGLSIEQSHDLWSISALLIESTHVNNETNTFKKFLVVAVNDHRDAWGVLVEANKKKDETAFTNAENVVINTYKTIQSLAISDKEQLSELTKAFASKHQIFLSLTKSQ